MLDEQWVSAGVSADAVFDFIDAMVPPVVFCEELLGFGFSAEDAQTMLAALRSLDVREDENVSRANFVKCWALVTTGCVGAPPPPDAMVIDLTGDDDGDAPPPPAGRTSPGSPYEELRCAVNHVPFLDVLPRWSQAVVAAATGDAEAIQSLQLRPEELARTVSASTSRALKPRAPKIKVAGGQTLADIAVAHSRWNLLGLLTASIDKDAHRRHWLVCPSGGPQTAEDERAGEVLASTLRAEIRATMRQRADGLCCFAGSSARAAPSWSTFMLPAPAAPSPRIAGGGSGGGGGGGAKMHSFASAAATTPPTPTSKRAPWSERLRYFGIRPQFEAEVALHLDAWSLAQPRGLATLYTLAGGDCLLCAAMQCMLGTSDAPPPPPPPATPGAPQTLTPGKGLGALRWAMHRSLMECEALRETLGWHSRAHPEIVAAGTPRRSLRAEHVWILSNILRRPIVVLPASANERVVLAAGGKERVSGVYLPTLWSPAECTSSPLLFAYVDGHFVALVGRAAEDRGLAYARSPKRRRPNSAGGGGAAAASKYHCGVGRAASPLADVDGILVPLVDAAGNALPLGAACARPAHAPADGPDVIEGWKAIEEWGYASVVWVTLPGGKKESAALEQPDGLIYAPELSSLPAYLSLFAREMRSSR